MCVCVCVCKSLLPVLKTIRSPGKWHAVLCTCPVAFSFSSQERVQRASQHRSQRTPRLHSNTQPKTHTTKFMHREFLKHTQRTGGHKHIHTCLQARVNSCSSSTCIHTYVHAHTCAHIVGPWLECSNRRDIEIQQQGEQWVLLRSIAGY